MEKRIQIVNVPESGVSRHFGELGVLPVTDDMPQAAKEIGLAKQMPYFEELPAEESATAPAEKKSLNQGQ
jgi:hypothetical protein